MDYYIHVRKQDVPVTEAVYKAYCQGERKERYFEESDIRNRTFYYHALDTEEMNGCDMFSDERGLSVEDQVEAKLMKERLGQALGQLNPREKEMIWRIYYYGQSLRQIAREKHIPLTTLQYRHKKTLEKLKKEMERPLA